MTPKIFLDFQTAFQSALYSIFYSFLSFLPQLLSAILILIVGVVLADFLKKLVVKVLHVFDLSKIIGNGPLEKFLEESGFDKKIEPAIGQLVRFLVLLVFLTTALNILGLSAVSMMLTGLLSYIPNIIAAVLILLLGTIFAGIVESLVKGSLGVVEIKTARVLGKTASYLVFVITILASLSQLNIAQDFVQILFIGFVATITIGLGLSLGLGSKDLVSKILNDWYQGVKKDLDR